MSLKKKSVVIEIEKTKVDFKKNPKQNKKQLAIASIRLCIRKEGNVLFNYALNTIIYLRLYGVGNFVLRHSTKHR